MRFLAPIRATAACHVVRGNAQYWLLADSLYGSTLDMNCAAKLREVVLNRSGHLKPNENGKRESVLERTIERAS